MKFESILYEASDGIATITINVPHKLNALTLEAYGELGRAFKKADGDGEVRAIILTGVGERAFCAGDDIGVWTDISLVDTRNFLKEAMAVLMAIEKTEKPSVAAVNGHALGSGCELCLACDVVIASEKAAFGLPEPKLGMSPGYAILRLPDVIGERRARRMLLTGESIGAQQAREFGLAHTVVPPGDLMAAAIEEAGRLKAVAPLSSALIKSTLSRKGGGEDVAYITEMATLLLVTEDAREGSRAFIERRAPKFQGK